MENQTIAHPMGLGLWIAGNIPIVVLCKNQRTKWLASNRPAFPFRNNLPLVLWITSHFYHAPCLFLYSSMSVHLAMMAAHTPPHPSTSNYGSHVLPLCPMCVMICILSKSLPHHHGGSTSCGLISPFLLLSLVLRYLG